ncbi:ThiF family, putative [Angomonas deanei]|uniref:ThiF family, putative n=1 Tax=Angomonas deanei TaxID=59799 RepID=A0A7G2C429_9TRYP|nr:ThiF family, putative [Angomonas deanei]
MKWSKEADQHRVEVLQTVVGEAIQHMEGEWCIPSAVQDKIRGAVGERARRGSFTPCIGLLHTDKEDGSVSIDFVEFSPSRLTRLGQDPSQRILLCYPHLSPVVYTGVLDYGMRNFFTVFRLALPQVAQLHLYGVSPAGDVFSHCDLGEGRVVDPSEAQGTGWVNQREPRVIPLLVEVEQKMRQNLLLLQWQRPELQLGELAACRALLLGAGSLGCQVASHLLMYGVRALTLVDCGRVDYNNLARQVLFTSEDAAQRRPKVEAAADGLRRVIPAVEVQTEEMRLPIPGDAAEDHDTITASIEKLIELVESHDVVFLLLDSYAGRWLPTLVAHAHGKPVINIALGFEEYLVMRHPLEEQQQEGVPCYFCNKVSLLRDNSRSATLDLQCTVTRPAVAGIAAALGVELLATAYQHPQQFRAPDDAETCLGRLYGMKRGTIRSGLEASALRERRNPYCVACSAAMTDAYRYEGGVDFLTQCIVNPLLPSQLMEEYRSVREGTERKENDSIQSFSSFSDA